MSYQPSSSYHTDCFLQEGKLKSLLEHPANSTVRTNILHTSMSLGLPLDPTVGTKPKLLSCSPLAPYVKEPFTNLALL